MIAAQVLIAIIAFLHLYFLVLEMLLWDKPKGMKAFGHNLETAKNSKKLAMNMGLYNGFLAAGLIWGLTLGENGFDTLLFFLSCITVAGIFGAITAHRKILYIQAFPAIIAIILLFAL